MIIRFCIKLWKSKKLVQLLTFMTLYVKPISALLTRDTETFSNMDPYVVVVLGKTKHKTKVHDEGGKKPHWNDVLAFKSPQATKLQITIMDKDVFTDDVIGYGEWDFSNVAWDSYEHKQYIALTYKNKLAGKLYISIKLEPEPGKSVPAQKENTPVANQPQSSDFSPCTEQFAANQLPPMQSIQHMQSTQQISMQRPSIQQMPIQKMTSLQWGMCENQFGVPPQYGPGWAPSTVGYTQPGWVQGPIPTGIVPNVYGIMDMGMCAPQVMPCNGVGWGVASVNPHCFNKSMSVNLACNYDWDADDDLEDDPPVQEGWGQEEELGGQGDAVNNGWAKAPPGGNM